MRTILLKVALCFFLGFCLKAVYSAEIRGEVSDHDTGEPLIGANVEVLGTILGTSTDHRGSFRITGVPAGEHSVRISMIGYQARVLQSVAVDSEAGVLQIRLAPSPIALNPVVVTADRRAQALQESPNSISVLPASELESRTSLRLDEALEMAPGVYFMKEDVNIRGSTGYRANSANRVLMLVDGVPVMTGDIGGISWDVLPMLDIDRVEVVKGAGSALWGSYAIGGVINVITKQPGPEGRLSFRVNGGSYDDPSEPAWDWAGDRTLSYNRVDAAYSKTFGNFGVRLSFARHASTGDRMDGDFEKWNVSATLSYRFRDASMLTLYASWLKDRSGVFVQWKSPFVADSTDASPSQLFHPLIPDEQGNLMRLNWLNTYIKYTRPISANSMLRVRASLLRSILGNQFQVSGNFFPANGLGAEIQLDWLPARKHYISLGSELKMNLVKGVYFGGRHTEYTISPFIQDEWQVLANLKLTTGVRFDRHELVNGPVNYQVNPRFGLNYRATSSLILRASSGRGFRVPTVAERTINFDTGNFVVLPNPDLKPEAAWSHEVGVRLTFGRMFLDGAVFQNEFENFIEARPDLSRTDRQIAVSFQNVARARIRGFEFGTGLSLFDGHFGLNGSVTFLQSEDLELDKPLPYRPRWIAQLNPSLQVGPFELRADYRFASRLPRVEIYTFDPRVAQHELNVRLNTYLGPLTITVGSKNILNYNYTQIERNLGEIRSFEAGIRGNF